MRPDFFKAFGAATLVANAFLFVFLIDSFSGPPSGRMFRGLVAFSAVALIGVGLIFLRKWAALYFSLPLFCLGIWVALSSIPKVTFPYNLLTMCEGISLMFPLLVTIRVWPQLTWRGKWFF